MALILTIENAACLSAEVSKSVRVPERGRLDIGRGPAADWLLPDSSRFVSAKHCEIRWRADSFWLYDISTNGTFVNCSRRPLEAPHLLAAGDRIAIGAYVLKVAIEPETVTHPQTMPALAVA